MQLTIDDILPTVTIDGREYRASRFRLSGNGRRWADVEYYHPDRGWRAVQNWDRINQVANLLWGGDAE
ncbi:hypothetical protein PA598K_01438 [Paenibacillus sp. 598K]|nr:hypothetical protein PA598K_01438 [Paenibacillus sp. 598K]